MSESASRRRFADPRASGATLISATTLPLVLTALGGVPIVVTIVFTVVLVPLISLGVILPSLRPWRGTQKELVIVGWVFRGVAAAEVVSVFVLALVRR